MPIRIYPNSTIRIDRQPPTGDLCSPQKAGSIDRSNLVDAPFETYYRTFTPLTSISPACRVCDGSKKFIPQSGIVVEEQNYRQISGFSDLIEGNGTATLTDVAFMLNGRTWGRRIEFRTQQIACNLNETPNPPLYTPNSPRSDASVNLEYGYAGIPSSITTGVDVHVKYKSGNDMSDPGANAYNQFAGMGMRGYATQFAFGLDGSSHLSNFNLSCADLLTIYDYSRTAFRQVATAAYPTTALEYAGTTAPPADEPTRLEREITVREDGDQYLYHMYLEKSRLRGRLPRD